MSYSVEQYKALPELLMPLRLKTGFVLTQLSGICPGCSQSKPGLKGEVTEYPNCSEVKFAFVCTACNSLVTCKFRYYKGGRCIQFSNDGWEEMILVPVNWWNKLKKWFTGRKD